MAELFAWLGDATNSKTVALLIFFTIFIGIVIYVYGSKKRSKRLESYRYMPFADDDDKPASKPESDGDSAKKG